MLDRAKDPVSTRSGVGEDGRPVPAWARSQNRDNNVLRILRNRESKTHICGGSLVKLSTHITIIRLVTKPIQIDPVRCQVGSKVYTKGVDGVCRLRIKSENAANCDWWSRGTTSLQPFPDPWHIFRILGVCAHISSRARMSGLEVFLQTWSGGVYRA